MNFNYIVYLIFGGIWIYVVQRELAGVGFRPSKVRQRHGDAEDERICRVSRIVFVALLRSRGQIYNEAAITHLR
ncbi:MAG: hypothetical protein HC785_02475 [Calothrix sp. CSU_2_0]|nr:hypothetical protein [Calothrix sp. CSU_2_0]